MTKDQYRETVANMTDKDFIKEYVLIKNKMEILDCEIHVRKIYRGCDGRYIRVKEEVIE